MKRNTEYQNGEEESSILLSHTKNTTSNKNSISSSSPADVFECKTCNRRFRSFQALGGHRASHNKLKMVTEKPKRERSKLEIDHKAGIIHECPTCGAQYNNGQALGGHMRRHRENVNGEISSSVKDRKTKLPLLRSSIDSNNRRVLCIDLNLTPLENDLKLLFGRSAPSVDPLI